MQCIIIPVLMLQIFVILSFFYSSMALSAPLFQAAPECACSSTKGDHFEEPIKFAFGKFAGQCVDSCRFRRARVLKNSRDQMLVSNLLHEGKYFQVRVKLRDIKNVEAGFERFAPGVDHVLLRFNFSHPLALFAQDGSGKRMGSTSSLVLSSEGVPAKGQVYSLGDGYIGHYLLAHRFVSGAELDGWVKRLQHPLRLLALSLPREKIAKVLVSGIERSDKESFQSAYRLFSNNCSTSAIGLIDVETKWRKESWDPLHWEEFEAALPIAGPLGTEHALSYRGLL